MLYLYALSEPPTTAPDVPGLDDTKLDVERAGEIDAVVSVLDRTRVEPSEKAILDHARVVDRLAESNDAVLPARFGRDYMRARLGEQRRTQRLAGELHEPLAAIARTATKSVGTGSELVLSAAYLVPREAIDDFNAQVARLGGDHPDVTLACTGPWPPYSFATVEPGSG